MNDYYCCIIITNKKEIKSLLNKNSFLLRKKKITKRIITMKAKKLSVITQLVGDEATVNPQHEFGPQPKDDKIY